MPFDGYAPHSFDLWEGHGGMRIYANVHGRINAVNTPRVGLLSAVRQGETEMFRLTYTSYDTGSVKVHHNLISVPRIEEDKTFNVKFLDEAARMLLWGNNPQ